MVPTFLAYIPGLVVGFLVFALLLDRDRSPELEPPRGPWPEGEWPAVTVIIAARNEEDRIALVVRGIVDLSYEGRVEVVLADNGSTDRTAESAQAVAREVGGEYRRVFEPKPGKYRALNTSTSRSP